MAANIATMVGQAGASAGGRPTARRAAAWVACPQAKPPTPTTATPISAARRCGPAAMAGSGVRTAQTTAKQVSESTTVTPACSGAECGSIDGKAPPQMPATTAVIDETRGRSDLILASRDHRAKPRVRSAPSGPGR